MHSTNGTRVNGSVVDEVRLQDGDLVQGGNTVMRVRFLGGWSTPELSVTADFSRPAPVLPPLSATGKASGQASAGPSPGAGQNAAPPSLTVPGFRGLRELGRGGMGVIYYAERCLDGQPVAIKVIRPAVTVSSREIQRFLRETRILQQLSHPRIVPYYESGEAGGVLYFVMEYIDGCDAAEVLRQQGRLPIRLAVGWLCEALEALQYAHDQGFVHRDVKPANLLIRRDDTCHLSDFGLARAYQASSMSGLTMLEDVGGTVPYMPPEQITHYREAKPPADQYAAAAALYHLLTGRFIFDFEGLSSRERLSTILCDPPIPIRQRRAEIPATLADVIHKALDKNAMRRFASAGEMQRALEKALLALPEEER
jgi:serine/threonine-protein kinase